MANGDEQRKIALWTTLLNGGARLLLLTGASAALVGFGVSELSSNHGLLGWGQIVGGAVLGSFTIWAIRSWLRTVRELRGSGTTGS